MSKSRTKKVAERLVDFAENKKQQAIINISNSTATGMILKWILTNKLSVVLSLVILFGGLYYNYHLNYYRELADRERIQELTNNLAVEKARTSKLLEEIEDLKKQEVKDSEINKELVKAVQSMSSEKKRQLLLEYRDRLLSKRKGAE